MGADCYSSDQIARNLTTPGSPLVKKIGKVAGTGVIGPDGELRRPELAKLIFNDPQIRSQVEAVMHPEIRSAMENAAQRASGAIQCFEIPLLIEAGLQDQYDVVVLCRCGKPEQFRRLTARLAGDATLARRIINSQLTDRERRPFADFVVMTNGPMERVEEKVARIWANLNRIPGVSPVN